jgi:hypothetical protein
MSRPEPIVLEQIVDNKTYKIDQVLKSDGIWAVYYKDSPINLKIENMLVRCPGPKYKRVSFSNPGHAINLAKKLNEKFNSMEFTVVLLTEGETIYSAN